MKINESAVKRLFFCLSQQVARCTFVQSWECRLAHSLFRQKTEQYVTKQNLPNLNTTFANDSDGQYQF